MPRTTISEIAPEEQARILSPVRRARYGTLLTLHILLLCAAHHPPPEIATVLFCSRSSGYRVVKAYHVGRGAGLSLEEVAEARDGEAQGRGPEHQSQLKLDSLCLSLLSLDGRGYRRG